MANETTVPVTVQLDVKSINSGIAALQKIGNMAVIIGTSFSTAFENIADNIQTVVASTQKLTQAAVDATAAVETLTGVMKEQAKVDLTFNSISVALSTLSTFFEPDQLQTALKPAIEGVGGFVADLPGTIMESVGNVTRSFVGAVSFTADDVVVGFHDTVAAVSDYIDVAKQATIDGNLLQTLFPKLSTTITGTVDSITEKVSKIRPAITAGIKNLPSTLWNGLKAGFSMFSNFFSNIFSSIGSFFGNMNIGLTLAIVAIVGAIILLIENFDKIKAALLPIWEEHLKPLWDNMCAFFASIGENLKIIWDSFLKPLIDWILSFLEPIVLTVIDVVMDALGIAIGIFSDIINAVMSVLDGIIQFIAGVFSGDWEKAWGGIVKVFGGIFEGIVEIAKGVVNAIIWVLNLLIGAIYSAIAGIVNGFGNIVNAIGSAIGADWNIGMPTEPPQIPYLAKGAVLPANRPFLAMVGDQKHGTNVEAPLATIQEALANVLAQQGMGGDIHITFTGDLAQLGRVLKPVIERENRRVGASLVKGVM